LERLGVRSIGVYTLAGLGVWLAFLHSGVHATIAGVIIGILTPARPVLAPDAAAAVLALDRDALRAGAWEDARDRTDRIAVWTRAARESVSPLEYLERLLHPWVSFVVMPVFALASAGVAFHPRDITEPVAVAVAAGLVVGKPVGIVVASCWRYAPASHACLTASDGERSRGRACSLISYAMALFTPAWPCPRGPRRC
jgi:NhaA family Na+:H+ antiporter